MSDRTRPPLSSERYRALHALSLTDLAVVPVSAVELRALLDHIERLHEALGICGFQVCVLCGCTEYTACSPPCWWAREDVCSACAPAYSDGPA